MKKKWSQKGGEDNQVQLKHQTKEGTFRKNTTKSTFRVLIKVSLPWTNGYWHHARQGTSWRRLRSVPDGALMLLVWSRSVRHGMMGASKFAATVIIAAQHVWGCTPSLVPRHARNPRWAEACWFWQIHGRAEVVWREAPAAWKLNSFAFMIDQLASQVAKACSWKALSYASQTHPLN